MRHDLMLTYTGAHCVRAWSVCQSSIEGCLLDLLLLGGVGGSHRSRSFRGCSSATGNKIFPHEEGQ